MKRKIVITGLGRLYGFSPSGPVLPGTGYRSTAF